jgi:hypothetical protein
MAVRDDAYQRNVEHRPTVIGPIAHLTAAKSIACEFALREFPPAEGWTQHHSTVLPATTEVMQLFATIRLLQEHGQAIEGDPIEQPEQFPCESPTVDRVPESTLTQ